MYVSALLPCHLSQQHAELERAADAVNAAILTTSPPPSGTLFLAPTPPYPIMDPSPKFRRSPSPPPSKTKVIRLRLQASDDEHVALPTSSLPENVHDVTSILRLETSPRSSWRDVASAYIASGAVRSGIAVLELATADDVDAILGESRTPSCSRTDLLAALAGAYVMLADSPVNPAERRHLLAKATAVFGRADLIDAEHAGVWAVKGMAEAAAGRVAAAKRWFENAYTNGRGVPAALGLAQCALNASPPEPRKAAELLAGALYAAPCPAATWTGLGYALARAGNLKGARGVLRRAVKASVGADKTERLEALYCLARVESAEPTPVGMESAFAAAREAYVECGGWNDPRVLTLIAEFLFLGGDSSRATGFAHRAVRAAEEGFERVCAEEGDEAVAGGKKDGKQAKVGLWRIVRANALTERARIRLAEGDFAGAVADYETVKGIVDEAKATNAPVPVNPGVYLRLGLLKLASGLEEDIEVAKGCLEKVLADFDERCAVAQRGLGIILGRRVLSRWGDDVQVHNGLVRPREGKTYSKAKELLSKGIESDVEGKKDVVAMLVYAALVEEAEPAVALKMYSRTVDALEAAADDANRAEVKRVQAAVEKHREGEGGNALEPEAAVCKPAAIPHEIYVNMASLQARMGSVDEAFATFEDKLEKSLVEGNIHLSFNRARLVEMRGNVDAAVSAYEAIVEREPDYHLAILRLGHIAANRDKKYSKAQELFESVLSAKSSPLRLVAAGYLNTLFIETKDHKAQESLLEAHRGESDYISLAFAQFTHSHLSGLGNPDRRNRFLLHHIAGPLLHVLHHSKRNVYAANGVGVFFAENGKMAEARAAFTAAGAAPCIAQSARVNLAHTTVSMAKAAVRTRNASARLNVRYTTRTVDSARGLCEQAEKLYSDAQRLISDEKQQGRTVIIERIELLLYRANAKYEVGSFRASADLLEKILHLFPESAPVWFNLGQVLRESADDRVMKSSKNLPQMLLAKAELEGARTAFTKASQLDRGVVCPLTGSRIDRKFLEHHAKYIAQHLKSHEVSIINARNDAEDAEKRRQEKNAKVEQMLQERADREANERKAEEDRKAELEKAAMEARERFDISQRNLLEEERRAREHVSDAEIASGGEGGGGGESKRKRRKRTTKDKAEKPTKKRKSSKKIIVTNDAESSDEYGDDDLANITDDRRYSGSDGASPKRNNGAPKTENIRDDISEESDDGFGSDDIIQRKGKKLALPDSGSDSDK